MKNTLNRMAEALPTVVQNTHLNVNLQGWPAAVSVIAICISGVAIYALNVSHPETVETQRETDKQSPYIAA